MNALDWLLRHDFGVTRATPVMLWLPEVGVCLQGWRRCTHGITGADAATYHVHPAGGGRYQVVRHPGGDYAELADLVAARLWAEDHARCGARAMIAP